MDDALKRKITDHYFTEYYQEVRAQDKSFAGKFEKFVDRNESALWGVAGSGIGGVALAAYIFPAVILTPVVLVPAAVVAVLGVSGVPAIASRVCEKYKEAANENIQRDIDSGRLIERYTKEVVEKDPHYQQQERKKLEEAKLAAEFAKAQQKEQEEAKAAEKLAEERLHNLKKNQPSKVVIKKD